MFSVDTKATPNSKKKCVFSFVTVVIILMIRKYRPKCKTRGWVNTTVNDFVIKLIFYTQVVERILFIYAKLNPGVGYVQVRIASARTF